MNRWSDWTFTGNVLEAALWWSVAALLIWKSSCQTGRQRNTFVVLSVEFFVFGVTDIIEAQTGAWWRPWWLLVLKGTCIVLLCGGFLRLRKLRKIA